MSSTVKDGKVKLLDTGRPNTLPKYLTDGTERFDQTRADPGLPSAQEIRNMLSASQKAGGADTLSERPDIIERLEAAKRQQLTQRREREKDLFLLDREPLNTFALPGMPAQAVMLPANKKKTVKKIKLKATGMSQDDMEMAMGESQAETQAYNEFNFLQTAMGLKKDGEEEFKTSSPHKPAQTAARVRPGTTPAHAGGQTSDLDEASVILQGLNTGDDVINFFARFGKETGVKFVHLQEVKDTKVYTPYDLVRIEGTLPVHEEFYTMSPAGIVHHCPGVNSEAQSLSAWMRHGMLFKILRNIGFYKYFLHRKIFNTWKDNVRYLLFARQRKNVGSRLYMTRKTTISAILGIKRHLMGVQNVRLLFLDGRTMEKDDFINQQTQNCVKSGVQFEDAMRNVTHEVQTVIQQIQNMHSRAAADPNNQAQSYSDDVPEKQKSLLKLRQEKIERVAMRKQAKLEYATLPDFIRFIDYLAVESLVSIAITTLQSFYDDFVKTRKNGVFETMVRFNSKGSYFSPTCAELSGSLEKLIDVMVNSVGNLNRVAYLNNKGGSSGGASIQSIIRNDRKFRATAELIKTRLKDDFERAEEHAHSFDSVRPIYDFNAKWDFAAFKAEQHDMGSFRSMMEMINDWNKELEKLRNRPIGVLEIDSKRLKNELNPLREARLHEIKDYIKDNARQKCISLTELYKENLSKLSNKSGQLKEFAGQVAIVNHMREEEKKLFKETFSVDQMYSLLTTFEVHIPPEDSVLHEDLHDKQQKYRDEVVVAESFKTAKLQEMVSGVDANIVKLEDQITGVVARLDDNDFTETARFFEAHRLVEELTAMKVKLESFEQVGNTYIHYQKLFDADEHDFANLRSGLSRCDAVLEVWVAIANFNKKQINWNNGQFTDLNVEEMDKEVQALFKETYNMHKKVGTPVTEKLKDAASDLRNIMPTIMDLGNPNMKSRHWDRIFKLIKKDYTPGMEFNLSMLMKGKIMDCKDAIGEISGTASGESQLEDSLAKIVKAWEKQCFMVLNHRDVHNLFILGSLEEIFTLLEDNQVTLQTMLGSRFIRQIQEDVETWSKKLAVFSETLDEWLVCQKTWMYLENIFGAEDIQKQLPAESQKFLVVDRSWKQIMARTKKDPLCMHSMEDIAEGVSLLDQFNLNNMALDSIQKSLEEYLETKRMAFPRFYFLSNDELLEILSQTRDPHAVQPHVGKCFDSIKRVKFGEGKKKADILGFLDPGGEYVALSEETKAQGPVESWLLSFEKGMRTCLYDYAKHAYTKYPATDQGAINRHEWLWAYAAQVVIAIDQVMWTQNGHEALMKLEGTYDPNGTGEFRHDKDAMKDFLKFSLDQINAMVDLVKLPLDKQQRTLLGALLTIDVHARDVTRALVTKNVCSLSDFEWTKQLRYYWDEKVDDVMVKQTNAAFQYGYEYLGNGPRLVITPLTDLCYMTLTGALHMRLGGAPAGPAGTGKTETTKDLAKALAVFCVVFNCSDGLDFRIMGRFFSGLAQQGAWSCFDEFNRIDIEVLSVIAQQILCIQSAIMRGVKEFDFEGNRIPLNYSFGVFITMNPGYAGRTELPDNLKSLFRPVAMMVPDYRLIAEIMLFSEGFANALPLSNKMAQLYALSSEQLSKQSHYDFGMRAVKTVLVAAGQLKRKEPDTFEDLLLIRAMRDSNVPKFLEQDIPLFGGILKDLFPGIAVPYVDYGKLQEAIENALVAENLQKRPEFISKVIQVHETQLVRHGMMIVGESGSGKSTNSKILAAALTMLKNDGIVDKDGFYKVVDRLILNPKSIAAGELYGEFNLSTNEWRDGIVPKLVRSCVDQLNEGSDNRKWVIFDGPVDAVWIENMNTVLDDNKMLCLANSERIKLPNTMHMLFEVQDLKVASPATVSRCGMVYMEQVHVGMLSLVRTWGSTQLKELTGLRNANKMVAFIEDHLEAAIDFLRYECKEKVATSNNQVTSALLNLIVAMLKKENVGADDPEQGPAKMLAEDQDLMNAMIVWCFTWSLGGNIHDSSRKKFAAFIKARFAALLNSKYNVLVEKDACYDMYLEVAKKDVKTWKAILPDFRYDANQSFFNILVPTVDTTIYRYLLDRLMNSGQNVLFMAETGVGKSVVISSFLNEMVYKGSTVSYVMGYSAQTKPANLRDVLESKLEKKRKNLLGPPSGKKMFLFVDDLNMPALETYGAQPPNELLRQIIDQGGFYDVNKLFFKNVQDVVVVSACAPPGGGRNEVSPRLLRHFHMVWLTNLSIATMTSIFSSILRGYMNVKLSANADCANPMVQASLDIYQRIQQELLPTPSKSHYTFNLRDLSKVFQGVLMVHPKHLETRTKIIKLWAHESSRVFRDRLINEEDREWFNDAVLQQLHTTLKEPTWKKEDFSDIIFGDFMTKENKEYQELEDRDKVSTVLMEYLDDYNISFSSRMDLVFFRDAINHVARIARVLAQPRGNALLVGVGGSGRQSLCKMASFMADFRCRQIEITRGYGMNEWHDNLKDILMNAGAKNLPTVFCFSDTQIVKETFLEDLNNILNSGEVPNLYGADELEKIVGLVRPLAKKAGKETRDGILQHYVHLVRENLHIVVCMSPIGINFRTRCRMFPSLVNCCTIDWFSAWPEDALYSVAHKLFESQAQLGIGPYVEKLSTMCNRMHRCVELETANFYSELKRYNYTTPTSYLELIKLYVDILKTQQTKISTNERRYRIGLDKLRETEEIVAKLEGELTEMQPVLEKASADTAALLITVTADQKDADAQAAIVKVDVDAANKVAASVQVIKDDCQADLDEAMPAYEAAMKALQTLDKKSIQEVKSFANPPEMVKFTLEAVCILMDINIKKDPWGEAKKLMSQNDFIDSLKTYDKDNIPKKTMKALMPYYKDERFMPEIVKNQSAAAMCLCAWVRAMVVYDKVAKSIEPKKAALKEAEDSLAVTMSELSVKKEALQVVLDRVATLQKQLRDTQQKKKDLETQANRAQTQLVRAGQLLGGLGGEKVRWQESAISLNHALVNLVGDMCLAAGCLAYLGPFTSQFRARIVGQWVAACKDLGIPCGDFTLLKALAEPVVVRKWQIDGLPADDFSCENGLLTTMGRRWPLMIDPQGQANRWVRNMYANSNLQIIKLTEKEFLRTLENGIRYGAPVLLENVGQELDPSLEPVLLKQVFKKAGQLLLRLGDTDVPYSEEFKFMITTKLANPHYMPEICIKVTVINFTVTMKGLEDQLLVDVIKNERPDLEERKDKLVVSIANDQKQLLDIEEQILSMLANASGNILDDEELINALALSKTTSTAINARLQEAETTTLEINTTREGYRGVATRGSIIYFVVANLALVDPMYQYSLQFYKALVTTRLQKTEKKENLEERLALLIKDITMSIYLNVCRGLFEKDKLLFAFIVAANINRENGVVTADEWLSFLVGAVPDAAVLEEKPYNEDSLLKWEILDKSWQNVVMLESALPKFFGGLADSVLGDPKEWGNLFTTENPHQDKLPNPWEKKLNSFQRLLLIRVLREEKIAAAIRRYIAGAIGSFFCESPPFDLEGAYSDSTKTTPLIFILSPGADPTDYLVNLAEAKGKGGGGLRIISLGQGQGPIAERAIQNAQKMGDWVCLQNCHLAVSWLAKLEAIVESTQNEPDAINNEYRLWLTSMPSTNFPVPVLQNGLKVTNEPPRGIKANLGRTFNDISSEDYESCSKPSIYKKLAFGTAFFNALILERRKFGAVGWNIPYEWMQSDLKAAMKQVKMYIEEQNGDQIPWETLKVSVSMVTYGGRVTDMWDKRTIASVLRTYYTDDIMNDAYRFSADGAYFAPIEGDIASVREYIKNLPSDDKPDVFGLHSNASITFQQKESKALLETIVTCAGSGGGGGGGGGNTDSRVVDIAKRISGRMPGVYDLRQCHPLTFKKGADGEAVNSLGVFLGQELIRFNELIEVMAATLHQLQRAIKGEVVMDGSLEMMYSCFVFQKVPKSWEDAGYPCLKPLPSWTEDFLSRVDFMGRWLKEGPRPAYWLSGFFFPQGFMTAVKQTYSRDTMIAVDTLRIASEMTCWECHEIAEGPPIGAYIYGLFMEGGRFDRKSMQMDESQPRQLLDDLPAILLKPVIAEDYNPQNIYNCPLYKTSIRAGTLSTTGHSTNFVVTMTVPSLKHEDHWVRRGCAMLCMRDD